MLIIVFLFSASAVRFVLQLSERISGYFICRFYNEFVDFVDFAAQTFAEIDTDEVLSF